MIARDLGEHDVVLVAPDVERDAPLAVEWINKSGGKQTLLDMGNPPADVKKTSLAAEQARVQGFIDGLDQINWMIQHEGEIVGSIWVDLKETEYVKSPAVHLMIGSKDARGKGAGGEAVDLVVEHVLRGRDVVYSRYLTSNKPVAALLENRYFEKDGEPYTDKYGLEWQNVSRD